MDKKYSLRILPIFEEDLNEIVDYISINLKNPVAAHRFVDEVEKAIMNRLSFPVSYEPYKSQTPHPHPYYRINVKNFSVFYVVIDDVMEVRRIVYSRRDLTKII